MFSTVDIPAGEIILEESTRILRPAIFVPGQKGLGSTPQGRLHLLSVWRSLTREEQATYLNLHEDTRAERLAPTRQLLKELTGRAKYLDGFPVTAADVEANLRIISIFHANAFELDGNIQALFLTISRINHSCIPNAERESALTSGGEGHMTIRATRDIKAGEEITMSYHDVHIPRSKRQANYQRIWNFVCACPACDEEDDTLVDSRAHERAIVELAALNAMREKRWGYSDLELIAKVFGPGRRLLPPLEMSEVEQALEYSTEKMRLLEMLKVGGSELGYQYVENSYQWRLVWVVRYRS